MVSNDDFFQVVFSSIIIVKCSVKNANKSDKFSVSWQLQLLLTRLHLWTQI